jgi:hypothetical protein
MKTIQSLWTPEGGWLSGLKPLDNASIVFLFGSVAAVENARLRDEISGAYPGAVLAGCSTAGEIGGTRVYDGSLVATAVRLERTKVVQVDVRETADSVATGVSLAKLLPTQGLTHVMVFSDGLKVNGSDLVAGLKKTLPAKVEVTGGLSGDGGKFVRTVVVTGDGAQEGRTTALGFYGAGLLVGFGSVGGWDPFGPERQITRSTANVLYELDGQPALDLYKKYLGEFAAGLPGTGLRFPLDVWDRAGTHHFVRTILAVDEGTKSLTFAGNVPQGFSARLMKANSERLIDGASHAARNSLKPLGAVKPELAVLVSCVGRKLVLQQKTEEELEAVRAVMGGQAALAGFYSYGEIAPDGDKGFCELHNQTMTVTALAEGAGA